MKFGPWVPDPPRVSKVIFGAPCPKCSGDIDADDTRNLWSCRNCGIGGDAISFVMQADGLTFPDAVEAVARLGRVD